MDRQYAAHTSPIPPDLPVSPALGFPRSSSIGQSPTQAGPYWFHMITESLRNVIVEAGLEPLASDLTLLTQAIRLMAGGIGVPAGAVAHFARSAAPDGWLVADGAIVSRSTYAALFDAIGTTFGVGDGVTTFKLPDLRGEFIRGLDGGRGVDAGRVLGSVQEDDFQSHTHEASTGNAAAGVQFSPSGIAVGNTVFEGNPMYLNASDALHAHSVTVGLTGGAETRPRNVALLVCIKF